MARAIWKGAISFGLVHVPVALYPASQEEEIDFDWLDKRTMDPVGYKRINKKSGKEIDKDNIVKGVKQEDGSYVVLSDDEIKAAYPKRTQTIEIESFVGAQDLSFMYIEKPYYLEPVGKSEKVYALLRESMADSSLIGIARIVIHNKEHLAALIPAGPALTLGVLRWANEIRSPEALNLPAAGKAGLKDAEMKMARQLIKEMSAPWKPEAFKDEFSEAILDLVARKAKAGDTHEVAPLEEAPDYGGDNVVDLTALLKQSLGKRSGPTKSEPEDDDADSAPAASKGKKSEKAAASNGETKSKPRAIARPAAAKTAKRSAPASKRASPAARKRA